MKIGKFSKIKKIVLRIFGVLSGLFGHASWKTKRIEKNQEKWGGGPVQSKSNIFLRPIWKSKNYIWKEKPSLKRTVSFIKPTF